MAAGRTTAALQNEGSEYRAILVDTNLLLRCRLHVTLDLLQYSKLTPHSPGDGALAYINDRSPYQQIENNWLLL